jgi:hypothetical protein
MKDKNKDKIDKFKEVLKVIDYKGSYAALKEAKKEIEDKEEKEKTEKDGTESKNTMNIKPPSP